MERPAQSHSACKGARLCDLNTCSLRALAAPSLPDPADLVLLLRVQPPARVQGTERLTECGAQRALHQRLVVRARHVPAQEQHRVCCQLLVRSGSEGTGLGGGNGGGCARSWSWSPRELLGGGGGSIIRDLAYQGNRYHTVGPIGVSFPLSLSLFHTLGCRANTA